MRLPRAGLHELAAAALAALFLAQVFSASLGESLTWDEPGYIAAGYVNWTRGDYRLNADHPPLMQKLQGLPLLFMQIDAPDPGDPRYLDSPNPRATYGRDLLFFRGNDLEAITRWGRAPVMLLGVALVLCVYAWGRALFGTGPALLATALVALCPNLVAHARLATEDLGCAALMFASVWTFWRGLEAPGAGRSALCGALTGLALLSKYTALLLAPSLALLSLLAWRRSRPALRPLLGHLAGVGGVALLVVGLGYGLAFRPDLYWEGIFRIYPDVAESYVYYFWGRVFDEPRWYHALASVALKTPVPTLALLALAAWRSLRAREPGADDAFLLVPAGCVLLASCFDATNPGIRRVLPALPFLLLFAARAVTGVPGRLRTAGVAACVAALAAEAVAVYPHHLSYLNLLAGGPRRGPYVFDESNIDWGQDLPALAAWQRARPPGEPLRLLYFGSAVPSAYGVEAGDVERAHLENPPPGTYAISTHYLAFLRKLQAREGGDLDWLTRFEPVDRAGHSIWIYRFPEGGESEDAGAGPRPSR